MIPQAKAAVDTQRAVIEEVSASSAIRATAERWA